VAAVALEVEEEDVVVLEAAVAVVNHRHGTPDWMPIQLKLRDDLEEAVATYKHYDVMLVNAMFDGMNLVAKEGPLVNERNGVSILSENTGAHEELGEWALSVNPFDIKETADSIHRALTMSEDERERRCAGLKEAVTTLEALRPEADAILAEAKEEVAVCDQDSKLAYLMCLGKALAKQNVRAASLAGEALVQSTRVAAQLSAAVPNAALCGSNTSSASIAQANEIAQATVNCFQDKLGGQ